MAAEPAQRFNKNEGRERKQKSGLDQRRESFDLGVAVLVLVVGRLMRDPYGEIGESGRADVGEVVGRLRQHSERSRQQGRRRAWPTVIRRTDGDRSQGRAFLQSAGRRPSG